MEREKRELRQLKREIKRKGSQHRRRVLKQALRDHPEDAAHDVPSVGKYVSAELNGLDRTERRRRSGSEGGLSAKGGRGEQSSESEPRGIGRGE
jgi:hypothetical protein